MLAKLVNGSPVRIGLSVLFVLVVILNSKLALGLDFKELSLIAGTLLGLIAGETVNPTDLG